MLLRRVIEHVKAQNWTAVALDFFIVVFGVFIGIQVSNWNDAREAREDGAQFLVQLHDDIVLAEEMSSRVLDRRLQRSADMIDAVDVLFGRAEATALTPSQCTAIYTSSSFEVPIATLGSFDELVASGRISIISDASLRTDLLALQQLANTTRTAIAGFSAIAAPLERDFPGTIENDAYFDVEDGEVRAHVRCNLEAMRDNRAFLNTVSTNIDAQDAFIRDGLGPWKDQLASIHKKVDAALSITHNKGGAP